jgi:putative exporter of polyketide antibiotics
MAILALLFLLRAHAGGEKAAYEGGWISPEGTKASQKNASGDNWPSVVRSLSAAVVMTGLPHAYT